MSKSEHYQLDDDVAYDSLQHFIKLWKNGKDAFLNINCRGGRAWLSFSTYLGFQDRVTQATSVAKDKKPKASPSKIRRNQARAQAHREKRRQEAEAGHLHTQNVQSKVIKESFNSSSASSVASVSQAVVSPISSDKSSIQIVRNGGEGQPLKDVDCVKIRNQNPEASPKLKEPPKIATQKDVSIPHKQFTPSPVHNQQNEFQSVAELGRDSKAKTAMPLSVSKPVKPINLAFVAELGRDSRAKTTMPTPVSKPVNPAFVDRPGPESSSAGAGVPAVQFDKKLTMREKIKETILRVEHADLVKNGVPGLAYSPHEKAVREERLRMLQADLSNYCANNLFS